MGKIGADTPTKLRACVNHITYYRVAVKIWAQKTNHLWVCNVILNAFVAKDLFIRIFIKTKTNE